MKPYWHIHHDVLVEFTDNIQERIDYIQSDKPKNEIATRLRLMKSVKGKLPKAVTAANQAADLAWAEYRAVGTDWEENLRRHAKYLAADGKCRKALEANLPALEALHAKECGCKEWNGKVLIFPKWTEPKK